MIIPVKMGLAAVLAVTTLAASNCGANDAPVKTRDRSGAALLNMPNHFSTVALKCDGHSHLLAESDHGNDGSGRPGALAVVIDARSCPPGYRGAPR